MLRGSARDAPRQQNGDMDTKHIDEDLRGPLGDEAARCLTRTFAEVFHELHDYLPTARSRAAPVRSVRLRLTKRTGAIPWQVYPGDRHWFHSWGQVRVMLGSETPGRFGHG